MVGDISHECAIDFILGSPLPNPETHDRLFPTPGHFLALVFTSSMHFYYDNYLPGHFFEKSGGMLNFPYNNLWDIEHCRRLDPKLTMGLKHALCLGFTQSLYTPTFYP
jgi:hypothetical protein